MKIETSRFGELEVDKKDIIHLKDGVLGFENLKKFFIVDPGDQTLILWLQSTQEPKTAFPIIEPKIFMPDYSVKLVPGEMASLSLESLNDASVYTILTIPKTVTDMSANLKAPLIINNQTKDARQIVLQDNKLDVRYKMYKALKRYIVNYTSDDAQRNRSQDKTQKVQAEIHSPQTDHQNKTSISQKSPKAEA